MIYSTVMIISFLTEGSWHTVQTQLRPILEKLKEQSDQGLHSFQYCWIFESHYSYTMAALFKFKMASTSVTVILGHTITFFYCNYAIKHMA